MIVSCCGCTHDSTSFTFSLVHPAVQNKLQSTTWIMQFSSRVLLKHVSLRDWELNHSFPWLGETTPHSSKNRALHCSVELPIHMQVCVRNEKLKKIKCVYIYIFSGSLVNKLAVASEVIPWHNLPCSGSYLKLERLQGVKSRDGSRVRYTLKTRAWDRLICCSWRIQTKKASWLFRD